MGSISSSVVWPRVKFGDVVRQVKDKLDPKSSGLERYIAGEHMDTDDLRIRRWGEINENYLGPAFHMRFKPGQVLYGSRRTYLRKVAVPDFEGICANTTYVLESKDPSVLLPELLPFIMQTEAFHEHSIKQSKGSVNPYINFSDIAWYEFALPPLEEQRRILGVLENVDRVYEEKRNLFESTSKLLKSTSMAEFNRVRNGLMSMQHLSGMCSFGPQSGLYKSKEFYGNGYPMVHMGELFGEDYITSETEMQLVELSQKEAEKYRLTANDLLFGRRSVVFEGAGRCVLVTGIDSTMSFESSMLRVTIDPNISNNRYVFEWFNSPEGKRLIRGITTFTTVAGVKGSDVARLEVPVPTLEVQTAVAERLHRIRQGIVSTRKEFDRYEMLSKQIRESVLYEIR